MAKNIIFDIKTMSQKDKTVQKVTSTFKRAGAEVVSVDIAPNMKRTAGISYRELSLSFADSQIVIFRVKETGDIYQVLLNKKIIPIRNQEDHVLAIGEVVKVMESGRRTFQQKLARTKIKIPPSVKTAIPKKQEILKDKKQALIEAIEEAKIELDRYQIA